MCDVRSRIAYNIVFKVLARLPKWIDDVGAGAELMIRLTFCVPLHLSPLDLTSSGGVRAEPFVLNWIFNFRTAAAPAPAAAAAASGVGVI